MTLKCHSVVINIVPKATTRFKPRKVSESLDIIVSSPVCDNSDIIQMNYFFSEEAFENLISQQSVKKEKFFYSYQFPNSAWRVINFTLPTQ